MFNHIPIHRLISASLVLFLAVFNPAKVAQTTTQHDFPVVIYVSNQMGKVNPVNIKVSIDHKTIVDSAFANNGGYSWAAFKTSLKNGGHQIVITSTNGDAGLDVIFTADKPLWLVISYWGRNHFQLNISPKPVGFG